MDTIKWGFKIWFVLFSNTSFQVKAHHFKWKFFELETCTNSRYFLLNFYQINKDDEIRTHDHLIGYQGFDIMSNNQLNPKA